MLFYSIPYFSFSSGWISSKLLNGAGSAACSPMCFSIHTMSYQRPNLYAQPVNLPTKL